MSRCVFLYKEMPLKCALALAAGILGEAGQEDVRKEPQKRNGQCVIQKMEKLKPFLVFVQVWNH